MAEEKTQKHKFTLVFKHKEKSPQLLVALFRMHFSDWLVFKIEETIIMRQVFRFPVYLKVNDSA